MVSVKHFSPTVEAILQDLEGCSYWEYVQGVLPILADALEDAGDVISSAVREANFGESRDGNALSHSRRIWDGYWNGFHILWGYRIGNRLACEAFVSLLIKSIREPKWFSSWFNNHRTYRKGILINRGLIIKV